MVHINNDKTITTDGVPSAVISSTTYPITYYALDDVRVYKIVSYSDGTQYTSMTQEPRLQTSKLTVSGKTKQQFAFVGVSQYYNGVYQSKFPYITSVPPEIASFSTTETWSDNTTYTQVTTFETMIDGTDKPFVTNDGVKTPYMTSTTHPINQQHKRDHYWRTSLRIFQIKTENSTHSLESLR